MNNEYVGPRVMPKAQSSCNKGRCTLDARSGTLTRLLTTPVLKRSTVGNLDLNFPRHIKKTLVEDGPVVEAFETG